MVAQNYIKFNRAASGNNNSCYYKNDVIREDGAINFRNYKFNLLGKDSANSGTINNGSYQLPSNANNPAGGN